MWKNSGTARQATDDNTMERMRFACWMIDAASRRLECVIRIVFTWQQWLPERSLILRYTHITCPLRICRTGHGAVQTHAYRNSCTNLYFIIPVGPLGAVNRQEVVSIGAFTTQFIADSPFWSKSSY